MKLNYLPLYQQPIIGIFNLKNINIGTIKMNTSINLSKYVEDLYDLNCKTDETDQRRCRWIKRYSVSTDWKINIIKLSIFPNGTIDTM